MGKPFPIKRSDIPTVSVDYMVHQMKRMKAMWFRHRKWVKNLKPYWPIAFKKAAMLSFARFKNMELERHVSKLVLDRWSQSEKTRYFYNRLYRGRRVFHYDYRIEKGNLVLEDSYKMWPRKPRIHRLTSPEDRIRKVKTYHQSVRDSLLIKPSSTCQYVGLTPFPIGSQPQRIVKPNVKWDNFVVSQTRKSNEWYDPLHQERYTVTGAWPTQWRDFQKLCDPRSHTVTYTDYERAVMARGHKLLLPSFERGPKLDDVTYVQTNLQANCGLLSSRLFGSNHRKADTYLKPLAKQLFVHTGRNIVADSSVWSIGGRNRRQKIHVDKELRSRSLLIPEGPPKILGLTYAQPIYDHLAQINWGR